MQRAKQTWPAAKEGTGKTKSADPDREQIQWMSKIVHGRKAKLNRGKRRGGKMPEACANCPPEQKREKEMKHNLRNEPPALFFPCCKKSTQPKTKQNKKPNPPQEKR